MTLPAAIKQRLIEKGIFPVCGSITLDTTRELFSWIVSNRPQRRRFTILINSDGGSPSAVQEFSALSNTLARSVRLRGVAFGECGSAAFALLQRCHVRFAVEGCTFFIHNMVSKPKIDCRHFDPAAVADKVANTQLLEDELITMQCRKIGMDRSTWDALAEGGSGKLFRLIYCGHAVALKLIDRVIPRFEVF